MAMHATQSELGGHLDLTSMFLVAGFAAAYALMRWLDRGPVFFGATFLGILAVSELVELRVQGSLPVVDTPGNLVFALCLVVAIVLEVLMRRRNGRLGDARWIAGSVASMVVAFTIWNLAKNGRPLCDPHSLLQGHAAWHLLCALAAYCLYRYWASAVVAPVNPANAGLPLPAGATGPR
jgi:hypothetical protein